MKNENESNIGIYGREFEGALDRWEGDPRSAIGGNALGKATSTNEGGWVPPRDIGYTIPKVDQVEKISTTHEVFSHTQEPTFQDLKRADGTTVRIRTPRSL